MRSPNPSFPLMPRLSMIGRRGVLTGAAATAGGLLLSQLAPRPAAAKQPDTVVLALSAYPPSWRPFEHAGTASITVKLQLFRGLLGYDPNGRIRPEIAESYRLEGDRSYVFKIRDNAKFQNGAPVTAADVQYSLAQITLPSSTAYLRDQFKNVASVEVVDPKTVRITLHEPTPAFPGDLAGPYAVIIHADSAKQNPNAPVGAGPFKLTHFEKGVGLDFERFDGFYKPNLPASPKLRMTAYADENLRVAALESGDVDIIEYVPWQSMSEIQANKRLVLQETFGPFMYLVYNVTSGPFADARVRQAVSYAVNRPDVIKSAFMGHGKVLDGLPIEPSSEFYDEAAADLWPQDIDKARALLAEAGHADGFKTVMLTNSTYSMHQDTAVVVQQFAAGLGAHGQGQGAGGTAGAAAPCGAQRAGTGDHHHRPADRQPAGRHGAGGIRVQLARAEQHAGGCGGKP